MRKPAARGDLVVVEERHRIFHKGKSNYVETVVRIGVVTSVSREGKIKAWRDAHHDGVRLCKHATADTRYHLVDKSDIDVLGAAKCAADNPWPHNPGYKGKPFDSIQEAREALRPFLTKKA